MHAEQLPSHAYISVHDVRLVAVLKRREDLLHHVRDGALTEHADLEQLVEQLSTWTHTA